MCHIEFLTADVWADAQQSLLSNNTELVCNRSHHANVLKLSNPHLHSFCQTSSFHVLISLLGYFRSSSSPINLDDRTEGAAAVFGAVPSFLVGEYSHHSLLDPGTIPALGP